MRTLLGIGHNLWKSQVCINNLISRRFRHYYKNMESQELQPPEVVRGMRALDREAFRKCIKVPRLQVREDQIHRVIPILKKYMLKMDHLPPVRTVSERSGYKEILLHPEPVKAWESLPIDDLQNGGLTSDCFSFGELELSYDNWRSDEILKYVLSAEEEGLTSYSRIGHIIHLNLRDHLMPYKNLIGEVLLDKLSGCRTVVNKAANIDNTYRNFQLELICGDPEYKVETKENGVTFEFDFSRVYWNPRLCTEHQRIVDMLRANDVLYDVFAGVGPFSVPAAKKKCQVLANDLNPESFRWLQHNAKRNKCQSQMRLYNKDGRNFILEDVRADLTERWKNPDAVYSIHVTMNLPAMAVEFLDAFRGLYTSEEFESLNAARNLPIVHCYSFAKGEDTKALVLELVEKNLGLPLLDNLMGVHFVRNVAPNKDMYRVSFRLTKEILTIPFQRKAAEAVTTIDDHLTESSKRKRPGSEPVADESDEGDDDSKLQPNSPKIKCT